MFQEGIKTIIRDEAVDWWLPVSHTTTAITDTQVKTELEEAARVKVLGPNSVEITEMLDDKIAFLEEARSLNLPVPDYFQISSCEDVHKLCRQGIFFGRHFFLKPLNPYSEDRVCFDRIPDNEAELPSFLQNYQNKITKNTPYFVSEFIQVCFVLSSNVQECRTLDAIYCNKESTKFANSREMSGLVT